MALYNNWVITKKYASTEVAAISTQNKIEFVRFISSDDKFAQSDLESFDDLVLSTIKTKSKFPVSSVKISGSTVTVTGILNSTGNTVDYDMNTLLLVCKYNGAEFLAAATTAQTPFRLPAENTAEVTEYTIRPQLTLSNSDTVSTVVDPVSPATNERVDDEVKKLQDQINSANTDRKSIWDKIADLVDKSTNQTISGIKTFTSTIVGNISGNAESATKLKTAQKVTLTGDASGSATFDGTQAVGLATTLATVSQNDTTSSVSPNYNETFTTVDSIKTDTKGRVTGANTKTVKLPVAYVHPNVSQSDTTSAEAPNNGSTFDVVDSVKRNGQGHVTGVNTKTVTMPTQSNITGNAGSATKWHTARKVSLTGDLTGSTTIDGTKDVSISSKLNLAVVAELMYPIGSYYMSSVNKNPKDIFGVGVWEQVKGKVIVGVDEDDTDFASAGLTGGEKTHKLTIAEMPSHTHIQNSHNHTQNSHSHPANNPTLMGQNGNTKYGEGGYNIMGTISARSWTTGAATATNNPATATNQNTGGDGAHNNLQPFQTAYIWLRTA